MYVCVCVYVCIATRKKPNKDGISDKKWPVSGGILISATELATENGCRIFARR